MSISKIERLIFLFLILAITNVFIIGCSHNLIFRKKIPYSFVHKSNDSLFCINIPWIKKNINFVIKDFDVYINDCRYSPNYERYDSDFYAYNIKDSINASIDVTVGKDIDSSYYEKRLKPYWGIIPVKKSKYIQYPDFNVEIYQDTNIIKNKYQIRKSIDIHFIIENAYLKICIFNEYFNQSEQYIFDDIINSIKIVEK